ncbi:MAG: T9SS type A sorting domain-containing protein [Candidatus Kapaibacterium sp.]
MKKIILLFLISTIQLTSQVWINYDMQELNIEYIDLYDLDLDSRGNLWLASLSGLIKFDGEDWTVFDSSNSDLPQNNLYSVEIDKEDNIWIGYSSIGSSRGLAIFNGQNWKIYNKNNSTYSLSTIRDIIFDKNETPWFAVDNFLWTFQNGDWTQIKHNSEEENSVYANVREVEVDKNNDIWFSTSYDGVLKYSNGKLNRYSHINPYSYDGLAIDSNNNIWLVNIQESLMSYDTNTKQWKVRDTNETPISSGFNIEHTIIVDRINTLWIAERKSVHNFNPATEEWITYSPPQKLLDSMQGGFRDMKIDANGDFWLITYSYDGVYKLSDVITEIKDEPYINTISIYPNPTSTLLTYETNNITSIIQQSIVDLSGKVLIKDNMDKVMRNSIDVSKLQSGVYFLQLTDMKGVKYSKKFVIED